VVIDLPVTIACDVEAGLEIQMGEPGDVPPAEPEYSGLSALFLPIAYTWPITTESASVSMSLPLLEMNTLIMNAGKTCSF
jgi:hypothetical protein